MASNFYKALVYKNFRKDNENKGANDFYSVISFSFSFTFTRKKGNW